jgi:protein-disulfide isomerase
MPLFSSRTLVAGLISAILPLAAAVAADPPKTDPKIDDAERAKIESVVHDYLLQHPETILQAVQDYQEKMQAEKEKEQAEKDKLAHAELGKRTSDLLHDAQSQVLGNAKSDCAVVEFFDNQCPYCQLNEPELQKLLKEDGRVKLILKEFPILGPTSITAAKAALASVKQGKYAEFHAALLSHKGHYANEGVVDEVAKAVGLDLDRLHKDMGSPEIAAEIGRNLELGRTLDINGTPGFVIGDQIFAGATTIDELKKYVADACKG